MILVEAGVPRFFDKHCNFILFNIVIISIIHVTVANFGVKRG